MENVDCLVFRSFITLRSIQMSTSFLNQRNYLENLAQINTLHGGMD